MAKCRLRFFFAATALCPIGSQDALIVLMYSAAVPFRFYHHDKGHSGGLRCVAPKTPPLTLSVAERRRAMDVTSNGHKYYEVFDIFPKNKKLAIGLEKDTERRKDFQNGRTYDFFHKRVSTYLPKYLSLSTNHSTYSLCSLPLFSATFWLPHAAFMDVKSWTQCVDTMFCGHNVLDMLMGLPAARPGHIIYS
jgi:hypothetical protein